MLKKCKIAGLVGMVLLLLAISAFSATTISISDVKGSPGETITAELRGTGDGIAGINFTIAYDPLVLTNPLVTLGDLTTGFALDQHVPQDGEVRAVIYSDPVGNFKSGEGVIAKVAFTVDAGATPCQDSALTIDTSVPEKFGLSDDEGVSITGDYTTQNGTFGATYPGDLNYDGGVNMLDYSILSAYWGNPYTMLDYSKLSAYWGSKCQ